MSDSTPAPLPERPRLNRLFRLQWEEAQQAYVLLYPEGMVKLNLSAAEILKRCDGDHTKGCYAQPLKKTGSNRIPLSR
jgi:pyrroloquinoline quinone biosynthesis protein D